MRPSGDTDRGTAALGVAGRAAAAACGVLAVAFAAFVVWRSAALLALLYGAVIIAIVLDRPVTALARHGVPRAWALALVLAAIGAIAVFGAVVVLGPLVGQAADLATEAPALAERLRVAFVHRFGSPIEASPLGGAVRDLLSGGAAALYGAAGNVANAAVALGTVLVLAVLLLASAPHLVTRAVAAVRPPRRPLAEQVARELSESLGGYLAGLAVIVAARLAATGGYLLLVGVPFVVPLTLVAGGSVLVPYLGAVLRLVSIGAVAWGTRGPGAAVSALAFVAAYDVVENYVVSPLVYRRTLGVSALGQLVAVLVLGYHFGAVGALLAVPLAATGQVLLRALRSPAAAAPSAGPRAAERDAPRATLTPDRRTT